MARYIDADELTSNLKKLENEYSYADGNDKYAFVYGALTGVRQAIIYAKAAPTVKDEWTSVDERPPELLQEVLCYRGNFKGNLMNTYTYLGQGMWKDDYGINYSTEEDGITHWMPLPEAPKGGTE